MIKGAGGPRSDGKPGDGTIRTGGRVPWGAEVEFAYTTGYDSHGRVSVNQIVDERGCSVMLKQPDKNGGWSHRRQAESLFPIGCGDNGHVVAEPTPGRGQRLFSS